MELRHKVVSALRWSAAARALGQLVSWGITIVVIRLLDPQDYGLMAMAMVVVSGLILLNTWGLDAVLVQTQALTDDLRRQVFGLVTLLNLAIFLALVTLAPAIAALYEEPALTPVLRLLSVQFLVLIFETLPQSALERELAFAHRSVVDFTTLVMGSVTTLALALLDYGVWALAWGAIVANAARVFGLALVARNLVWPRFSLAGLRPHLAFGGFVSLDRGLWFIFSESDKFVGGKLLGSGPLGYYAVASQLAAMPIHKVTGLLNAVAFPAFSQAHAQASMAGVRDYLRTATRLMSIVAIPVFFGISCTAEPLVAALLGAKWVPAAPLLQVMGLVMPFRLLGNVFPPLLWGVGHPRTSATNFALAALLMVLAFVFGAQWGALGLAFAWLAMYPVVFLVSALRTCRVATLPLAQYLLVLWRPVVAGVAMYLVVLALPPLPADAFAPWLDLARRVLIGAAAYLGALWWLDRTAVRDVLALVLGRSGPSV